MDSIAAMKTLDHVLKSFNTRHWLVSQPPADERDFTSQNGNTFMKKGIVRNSLPESGVRSPKGNPVPPQKGSDPKGEKLALHLLKEENRALRDLIEKQLQKIQRLERRRK
jgi:hypothetical protein